TARDYWLQKVPDSIQNWHRSDRVRVHQSRLCAHFDEYCRRLPGSVAAHRRSPDKWAQSLCLAPAQVAQGAAWPSGAPAGVVSVVGLSLSLSVVRLSLSLGSGLCAATALCRRRSICCAISRRISL